MFLQQALIASDRRPCYNTLKEKGERNMKIVFVRHGHPNYVDDCLTELGHLQAAAAAERLKDEGIQEIYSSTCGRAMETAGYTAKLLGLPIIPCDFIREIHWGPKGDTPLPEGGHPWLVADLMASQGTTLTTPAWQETPDFCENTVYDAVNVVWQGMDQWLASLGAVREGEFYRMGENTDKTVAMFSHGGASSAVFSRLLNIPFPQMCGVTRVDFTSVTVIEFPDRPGALVTPYIRLFNDAKHIKGIEGVHEYGQ